jgi:iron complex transport system permease protein
VNAAPVTTAPGPTDRAHRQRRRRVTVLAVLVVAAVAAFMTVDVVGSWDYALMQRSRRVAAMLVVAVAVAVSTVLFQTVTTNRILTPEIMGFDRLFVLIQTLGVFFLGAATVTTADPRLRFAVEVVVLVVFGAALYRLVLGRTERDVYVLVLLGVVLGTLFSSVTLLASRLIDPNEFLTLQDLLFASFTSVDRRLLGMSAAVVAVVVAGIWRLLPRLDVVALGRETAVGLGVEHRRVMNQALLAVAVLVAVATALVGPVTFLGLLVANLSRQLLGTHRHVWVLPGAALLAVLALVGGQLVLEQLFGFNSSLSIVINFVGGIVFIALLLRKQNQ